MIIGMCGLAGSGKDTVADLLVKNHGFVKVALADPLKRICRDVFDFTEEQLWGPSDKRNEPDFRYCRKPHQQGFDPIDGRPTTIDAEYLTPRYALQQLGTEWGRDCYPNVWVDYALRIHAELQKGSRYYDAKDGLRYLSSVEGVTWIKKNVVISDVRFKNEIDAITKAGGKIYRLLRGQGLKGAAGQHRSEKELQEIPMTAFAGIIDNREWSLEQLEGYVNNLMKEMGT